MKDNELVGNNKISEYRKTYINSHAEEHNIYYLMSKALDYNPSPNEKIKRQIHKCDVNKIEKTKLNNMIKAYCIYNLFDNLVNSKRKYNIVFNESKESSALYNKITKIIISNYPDYDTNKINTLLKNVQDNIMDIKDTLNKYCNEKENKFHYMIDTYEKINYIINVLELDLSMDDIYVLCNFNNDGYMLLYLILHNLFNSCIYEQKKYAKDPELSFYIEYINENVKKLLNDKITLNEYSIEEIAKNVKQKYEELLYKFDNFSIKHIREELYKELSEELKNTSIDHFLAFEKLNKSNMVFDILSNQTKVYLDKKAGEDKNVQKESR
jgi:hypothetical protein